MANNRRPLPSEGSAHSSDILRFVEVSALHEQSSIASLQIIVEKLEQMLERQDGISPDAQLARLRLYAKMALDTAGPRLAASRTYHALACAARAELSRAQR